jgi:hypothetical protein
MVQSAPHLVIHLPVSVCGLNICNSFGVVIALASNATTAEALATLINLGAAEDRQRRVAEMSD